MKKQISLLLAALTVLTMTTGCKENDGDSGMIELTYAYIAPSGQADAQEVYDAFNEKLQEKLPGVKVNFDCYEASDYAQKILLMNASGEKLDLVQTYTLDFTKEVRNGTFTDMTELLNQYGKETLEALPDYAFDYMKVDGKIYGVPVFQQYPIPWAVYIPKKYESYMNPDFAETMINEKHTTNEIYDMMGEYFKKLNDADALGLGYKTDGNLGIKGYSGLKDAFYYDMYDEKCKITLNVRYPEVKEYYRRAAEWFDAGYIRKDILSVTNDGEQKYMDGGYIMFDGGWSPWFVKSRIDSNNFELKDYELYDSENYFIPSWNVAGGTCITEKCEHKEEAMKLINLLNTDAELYNLIVYGIEGKHYTKIDNETIEVPYAGQGSSNDRYGIYKWIIGNTALGYNTQYEGAEAQKFVKKCNSSSFASPLIGFYPDTSSIDDKLAQVNAVRAEYEKTLLSGCLGSSNWEDYYDEFIKKLDAAGAQEVEKELQRQVDEFLSSK